MALDTRYWRVRRTLLALAVLSFVVLLAVPGVVVVPSDRTALTPTVPAGPIPMTLVRPLATIPGGSVGAIRVTLHNTMGIATGPYQQVVRINSASFANLINSNWTNGVPYYTKNGTPLYGWIEANASNTSKQTTIWLSVASIASNGWANVSFIFWSKSSFNLSATGYMGEAPQLSASYGKFDNGAKVFNFYDNFAGTTLSSQWTVSGSWSPTVSNAFSVNGVPPNGASIHSTTSYAYPAVMDFFGDLYQSNPTAAYNFEGFGTSGCISCGSASEVSWCAQSSANGPAPSAATGGVGSGNTSVYSTQTYAVFTTEAVSSTKAVYENNYSSPQWVTTAIPPSPLPVGLAISAQPAGFLSNTQTTQWIRERTYVATTPTVNVTEDFSVKFNETGLPSGAKWSMAITGGPSASTAATTIAFYEPNGTYAFNASAVSLSYSASPASGSVKVAGSGVSTPIRFSLSRGNYSVEFNESGLPKGTNWNVTVGSGAANSTTTSVLFTRQNGTYAWSIKGIPGYSTTWKGNVTVSGKNAVVPVNFTQVDYAVVFTESGLPSGTGWSVTIASVSHTSFNTTVSFSEPNGSYSWSISGIPGYTTPWSGSVPVSGSSVAVPVTFVVTVYSVTFTETGLPAGTNWTVALAGNSSSTSANQIHFMEPNGTYVWSITPIPGWRTIWSGSVQVSGGSRIVPSFFTQVIYTLFFNETGLPTGTGWTVTIGSSVQSSTSSQIVFFKTNGTYPWVVSPIPGFSTTWTGSASVVGGATSVPLVFSRVTYTVTVTETGLPTGTNWSISMGSTLRSATTPVIVFDKANGTYAWSITPIPGYATVWRGTATIAGSAKTLSVGFTVVNYVLNFTETGLPKGTAWSVVVGSTSESSKGTSIGFVEPNGTFAWSVGPIPGYNTTWKGSATVRGSLTPVTVVFARFTYTVTFTETGLPSGTTWSVAVANWTRSGTGAIPLVGIPNGSYSFTVGPVPGYNPSEASGSFVVSGPPPPEPVSFSPSSTPSTFLGLPQFEGIGLVAGIALVAAVGVGVALWRRNRPRGPATEEAPAEPTATVESSADPGPIDEEP